jgi:hypothetical protein
MNLNHRENRKLFVAFDGHGDVSSYQIHKAVFSKVLEKHDQHGQTPMKFVDMFVAMHADFFIQNPRSTFSLQIYMVRLCLGLKSVPLMRNNDLFVQRVPADLQAANRPLWVSWVSTAKALETFHLD